MQSSLRRLALLCAVACALQAAAVAAIPFPVAASAAAVAKAAAPAPVQHTGEAAFFDRCFQGAGWVRYRSSCYKFNETSQYWYLAELECRQHGGHLVSIGDKSENSFVAKLTYCQSAWTGRYVVNVDRLRDPSNYRWTDGSISGQYHAHDFTSITSIHEPLISVANLNWTNRVYHSKDRFVCEAPARSGNSSTNCPQGWKSLDGFCYLMPDFETSWIEANYYCTNPSRAANLVSVHTADELRALSLLDLDSDGCPPKVWVGLIKVNPCRIDMFTGKPICYKWADRLSEFYNGFPAWHPGHPDTGEQVNCVLVQDRAMKTVQCYERHRFICKRPASA